MTTVSEAVNVASDRDPLLQGLSVLSQYRSIPFTQYIRYVLPLDGYIFWLQTKSTFIQGSLHVSASKEQNEDESIAVHRVVFTTGDPVQEFSEIGPNTIWVGENDGIKFAFSQQSPFYRAAGLFHYSGDAVYPALQSQLVETGEQFDTSTLIVSNSLPSWLTLAVYSPVWLIAGNPRITLYPSYAVPDNLTPPYGTIHIPPDETRAMAGLPLIGTLGAHTQLASDRVRITLYGLTNAQVMTFLDLVNQYSLDTDAFGIMGASVVKDDKRTQSELGILAMKKTIDFDVDYLQSNMPNVALQLITSVLTTFYLQKE